MANKIILCEICLFLIGIVLSVEAMVLPRPNNFVPNEIFQDEDDIEEFQGGHSFEAGLQEIDKFLQENMIDFCYQDDLKPKFDVPGRRISETKCLDYVWEIRKKEEANKNCNFSGVIDGETSKLGEYPHMAALGWKVAEKIYFRCSSFLISEEFILTAAHCLVDGEPGIARFGVVNILKPDAAAEDYDLVKFIKHPEYDIINEYNDVAIGKLATRVIFNDFVAPMCILKQQKVLKTTITGWGSTDRTSTSINDKLQVGVVNLLPSDICFQQWSYTGIYYDFQNQLMCANGSKGETDFCSGDSGGPLQTLLNTKTRRPVYNAIGMASFNKVCGSHNFPSIYVNLTYHLKWIEEEVWSVKKPMKDDKGRKPEENTSHIKPVLVFDNGNLYQSPNGKDTLYIVGSEDLPGNFWNKLISSSYSRNLPLTF